MNKRTIYQMLFEGPDITDPTDFYGEEDEGGEKNPSPSADLWYRKQAAGGAHSPAELPHATKPGRLESERERVGMPEDLPADEGEDILDLNERELQSALIEELPEWARFIVRGRAAGKSIQQLWQDAKIFCPELIEEYPTAGNDWRNFVLRAYFKYVKRLRKQWQNKLKRRPI